MRRTHLVRIFMLLALLMLVVTPWAWAASPHSASDDNGIVQVGQDWTLKAGERFTGDVLIVGANALVERGATLQGDLAVISGNVTVAGEVDGDISLIGGNVVLEENSRVVGDIAIVSGHVEKAPTAVVTGEIVRNQVRMPPITGWELIGKAWSAPQPGSPQWFLASLWRITVSILSAFLSALVAALIAAVLIAIWPAAIKRVAETVAQTPLVSFFVGIVTSLAVLVIFVLLAITICLLPFALLLLLFWLAAGLVGWTAIGYILGRYLWQALNIKSESDVVPTAIGVFVLSLLSSVPCVGTLFGLLVAGVGLGAVLISQFGRYVPQTA